MSAGEVNGYAVIWGAVSADFSERGPPRYERIDQGALKLANDACANINHFALSTFAFMADGSLQLGCDEVGIWFRAALAATTAGYGIRNSLTGGRVIGVSAEIDDVAIREAAGVDVVTRGLVVGIALTERPVYPQMRAWLAGEIPTDQQARLLHGHFAARLRRKPHQIQIPRIPAAMLAAMQMGLW